MIDFEYFDNANLTPQEDARFDSLAAAVTSLLNDESADPQLVLNVLIRVMGNAIGHWVAPSELDGNVEAAATGIWKQAKSYQAHPET